MNKLCNETIETTLILLSQPMKLCFFLLLKIFHFKFASLTLREKWKVELKINNLLIECQFEKSYWRVLFYALTNQKND